VASNGKPMVDAGIGFGFPLLFGSQGVTSEVWTLSLSGKGYFEL
jgi:hypothetical protein